MIYHFKYGFHYGIFFYGWYNKELYRLPNESYKKTYGLKKLSPIQVGRKTGYRIHGDRLTIQQLREITVAMDKKISIVDKNYDCPF